VLDRLAKTNNNKHIKHSIKYMVSYTDSDTTYILEGSEHPLMACSVAYITRNQARSRGANGEFDTQKLE